MNRDAKRLNATGHRPEIDNIKSMIRWSTRGFDGDGYPFKQAVKELRKEGLNIIYDKDKCSYFNLKSA